MRSASQLRYEEGTPGAEVPMRRSKPILEIAFLAVFLLGEKMTTAVKTAPAGALCSVLYCRKIPSG